MTHPTEAGERERIASRLEIRAAGGCNARAYITDPNCAARGRTVENWCSNCLTLRAANLLRTEPGGEAFDWRDLMGEIMHGDLYLTGPDIQVLSNDAVEEIFECYRRPTTPVEPDLLHALREAEAGLEFAISTIKGKAPEVDWEDSSPRKALRTVKEALSRVGAPVEERGP